MVARKEILYDGYFYDVTDFIKKHPGGTVIEYYTEKGEDSTHAIQQFHNRSAEKVQVMMNALKKRPAPDSEIELDPAVLKKNRSLTADFTKLYLDLKREGYFEPSYLQGLLRVMELFFWAGVGIALFYNQAKVLGFFLGLSMTRWQRQHTRHHAMPQRMHHDVDLDTMPLLAYNKKVVKNPEDGKRFNIRYQAYLFVLDSLLIAMIWQMYQDPKFMFKRKKYYEMFSVAMHCVLFYHIGFWPWILASWGGSFYMLLTFSMNHTFLPVTDEPTHWVEYSFRHSANLDRTPLCDWATGHLNYQIEHHLFPTMPNFRLPYISDRVKQLGEKHNLPYNFVTYSEGIYKTFKNMADVAKEVSSY